MSQFKQNPRKAAPSEVHTLGWLHRQLGCRIVNSAEPAPKRVSSSSTCRQRRQTPLRSDCFLGITTPQNYDSDHCAVRGQLIPLRMTTGALTSANPHKQQFFRSANHANYERSFFLTVRLLWCFAIISKACRLWRSTQFSKSRTSPSWSMYVRQRWTFA